MNMSSKKKKLKALKEKRDALVETYKKYVIFLSGIQDQIADIEGDIRMLEDEQEKETS
tara:strand:+ start:1156 stop:1329 length:174 start_codon:yes stop_codon:yes gene_type:complete